MKFSNPFKKFNLTPSQQEAVKDAEENYARYDIAPNSFTTSLAQMRSVNDMLLDPVIASSVALLMETAFQMNDEQQLFTLSSWSRKIENELNDFHKDLDIENFLLTLGYNVVIWGNLPIEHKFDKAKQLVGATLIGDFTKVTPIILGGVKAGYTVDGEYKFPFEYTYAQMQHYKNLGGPYGSVSSYITQGDNKVQNEFVYAPSYLSSASKAWRNVNIIEDALLLARMDQSNYYRIIGVDVGGSVFSKPAIKALNYYRNIFKKVRKVSYDPSGMSSRGTNQEFEVIVPMSGTQGINVSNVGGDLNIEALKDLDTQYSRLFSALRVNPSMIGFDSKTPGTLNGEGPGLLWDERFGKTCKAVLFSVYGALREIDTVFLRSRGYSVEARDWTYNIPAAVLLSNKQRADMLTSSVDTIKDLTQQFRDNDITYDKKYLYTSVLKSTLSLMGVDTRKLFDVEKEEDAPKEPKMLGASKYMEAFPLTTSQRKVLVASGLLDESADRKEKVAICSSIEGKPTAKEILFQGRMFPTALEVELKPYVQVCPKTLEEVQSLKEVGSLETLPLPSSVFIPSDLNLNVTVSELDDAAIGCISNAYLQNGNFILTSKDDVLTYLALLSSGNRSCVVGTLHKNK